MEAVIAGTQRKVMVSSVRPLKAAHGDAGLPLRDGKTLPFVIHREWSAPAGRYVEQWFIIVPGSREVLFEGPLRQASIWGLQSLTPFEDVVTTPLALAPGTYQIVFALGGVLGGELDVEAREAPAEEAA